MSNPFREGRCNDFLEYLAEKKISPSGNTAMVLAIVWNGSNG